MSEYEELNPHFKESLLNWMETKNPFWSLLGMEIIEIKKGWAKIRLPFSEKLANGNGGRDNITVQVIRVDKN